MTQAMLKLVEGEPNQLTVLMGELRAKARAKADADRLAQEASLAAVVDEIELALSIEHGELEELRQLARLRQAAAHQHAIRIGKLLLQAKRKVPHGQWQEWVKENFSGKAASEYMRIAKTSKRGTGQMNNDATEYKAVERAQVEEAKRMVTTLERQREREAAKAALFAFTESLRRPDVELVPVQPLRRRF